MPESDRRDNRSEFELSLVHPTGRPFEGHGAEIIKHRMTPGSIVEDLDGIKDVSLGLLTCRIRAAADTVEKIEALLTWHVSLQDSTGRPQQGM